MDGPTSPQSFGVLQPIAEGARTLSRGASGPEVFELQALLERAGYGLARFGADGSFGGETARALMKFQVAAHLPATGVLDASTLSALVLAGVPRAPDYQRLFADGVLQATLAVGYDEAGWHRVELEKILDGLSARGFEPLDITVLSEARRQRLGIDESAPGTYFSRDFVFNGQKITAVLQLVKPDQPDARDRFAKGISGHELVLYGGHGRYGSGPDFDDIHSPKGNFVIGRPFEEGHVTLGANDLERTAFSDRYQLLFFDGCNTFRYFDDVRARARGKSTGTLDVIGSTTELYWDDTADNLFAVLDGVLAAKDFDSLSADLDAINRVDPGDRRRYFVGNGFDDNP
ncbi:MAG: peptidoglycan-binding domain-containing protein [Myxococcota bacterium]